MISESEVPRKAIPRLLQLAPELDRVGQVAVVGERQLAAVVAPDRLRVLPGAAAGGRVADVADRHVALQRPQLLLVEDLGDEAGVAHRGDVAALAGGDPGRLLAAVLERVEAEVGEAGDVVAGCVYAEDAALVARSIAVGSEAARAESKARVSSRLEGRDAQADCLPRQGTSGRGSAGRLAGRGRPSRSSSASPRPAIAESSGACCPRRGRGAGRPRSSRRRGRRRSRRPCALTPSSRRAAAIGASQLWKAAVAAAARAGSSGRASAAAATGQPSRSGWFVDPAAEDLAEHRQRLAEAALVERAFDRGADLAALELRRLDRELALAAGEVVVDRAPRRLAALGDVAQLHPGVALLGEQLAGRRRAAARARRGGLRFDRLSRPPVALCPWT